jgi:hypothetical protein
VSDRCDLTDLLVDQCAHCRGDDQTIALTAVDVRHVMAARHPSRCALDSNHTIEAGDRIGYTDDGWICDRCIERASEGL